MCNLNTFFKSVAAPVVSATERIFTAPGTGGLEAAQQAANAGAGDNSLANAIAASANEVSKQTAAITASTSAASAAAATAAAAQADALKKATAAATPIRDQESSRRAAEDRMRRLLASGGINFGAAKLGSPPVGYRMLTGS